MYRKGIITIDDLEGQLAAVKAETEAARARLRTVEQELADTELRKVQLTTIEDRLGEIRSILDGGLSYEVKRQIVELLVTQVKVTTAGEGADRHIDAEVTFAFDRDALCSDYTDMGSSRPRA